MSTMRPEWLMALSVCLVVLLPLRMSRIARIVAAKEAAPMFRVIGTVDAVGQGTEFSVRLGLWVLLWFRPFLISWVAM